MKYTRLLSILALLSHITSPVIAETEEVLDCIIVGAGFAGIAAAKTLKENGITDFVVLEARDRIGGRSYTSYEFGESIPHDMGSFYLTSVNENPLFDYLDDTDIDPFLQDATPLVIGSNGTIFSNDLYLELLEKYWVPFLGTPDAEDPNYLQIYYDSYFFQLYNFTWYNNVTDDDYYYYYDSLFEADVPLSDIIDKYVESGTVNIPDTDEGMGFFSSFVERYITSDFAGSTTDLSFLYFDEAEAYNGSNFYVAGKQKRKLEEKKKVYLKPGFKALVDSYAADVVDKIQLNSIVKEIGYESDPANVTYTSPDGEDEVTIKAKTVIVTVPVGVLRDGDITFKPELDTPANYWNQNYATKEYAMEHIGPGKIIHCALYWENDEDVFWPNTNSFIQLIPEDLAMQGRFTLWVNFFQFNGGIPILMGTVNGDHVDDMADMTDEEIVAEALAKLRTVFDDVPDPTNSIVHNWLTDEFAKSAYSYYQVDAYDSRNVLSKKLPGNRQNDVENWRLHFAGEATSDYYFGLLQGAVWEGERAGAEAFQKISLTDSPTASPSSNPISSPTASPTASPTPAPNDFLSSLIQSITGLSQSIEAFVLSIFAFCL